MYLHDGIRPQTSAQHRHNIGKRAPIGFAVRTRHIEKDTVTRSGVIVARRRAEHIDGTEKVPRTEVKVHLRRAAEAAVGVPGGVVLLGRARFPGLVEAATVATEPGRGPHHLSYRRCSASTTSERERTSQHVTKTMEDPVGANPQEGHATPPSVWMARRSEARTTSTSTVAHPGVVAPPPSTCTVRYECEGAGRGGKKKEGQRGGGGGDVTYPSRS